MPFVSARGALSRHALVPVVGGLAGVALLAGCSTADPAASASSTPSPLPTASVAVAALDDRPLNEQLQEAIQSGDAAVVVLALDAGADPNHDLGAGVVALTAATMRDDAEMVAALIAAGADVAAAGDQNMTALHRAGEQAGAEVTTLLIEAGAPWEVYSTDPFNVSPIHAAAVRGNLEALQAMLEAGFPVEPANPVYGASPLFHAAYQNQPGAIEMLVLAGADVNFAEDDGDTPLDIAISRGSAEAIAMLESLGGVRGEELE